MNSNPTIDPAAWPQALATVLSCTYNAGAGRALAFGIPTSKHFRIAYNYFANDELHTGQFDSEKALPQGTLFPIRYNPDAPHQNSHDATGNQNSRASLLTLGIVGSVVLSLAWVVVLHGCFLTRILPRCILHQERLDRVLVVACIQLVRLLEFARIFRLQQLSPSRKHIPRRVPCRFGYAFRKPRFSFSLLKFTCSST